MRGEPLSHHGPGWVIRRPGFEVTCWAPLKKKRDEWLLSVETGRQDTPEATSIWHCGSFLSGDSLVEVLPALAVLKAEDRYAVIAVLIQELGQLPTSETCSSHPSKKGL